MRMTSQSYQIAPVVEMLLDEPNVHLSTQATLRYGSKGSLSVDLLKNCYFDFELNEGGGVLNLISRQLNKSESEAAQWYVDNVAHTVIPPKPATTQNSTTSALKEYVYTDEHGNPAFRVTRTPNKGFRQESWNNGKWSMGAKNKPALPYRLPQVLEAMSAGRMICVVEGEKDVETLENMGIVATCNAGGAGKWISSHSEFLRGGCVLVIPDNDEAGIRHAQTVKDSLQAVDCKVKILALPDLQEKEDITDWINKGHDLQDLIALLKNYKAPPLNSKKANWKLPSPVILTKASEIEPEAIDWLWRGYLARGKLHILASIAGLGKTTLAISFASSVSNGNEFPDGSKPAISGNVVIWSGEDSARDTLVPRLIAAGADLNKIHIVSGLQIEDEVLPFDPAVHIPLLNQRIMEIGGAALLIIDPIISAVRGDSHKANEVRRSLQPVVDLAEQSNCAVLGITHFAKGTKGNEPQERVIGSQAFAAMARTVFVCVKSDDSSQRVFTKAKSNISCEGEGFYYDINHKTLGQDSITASYISWGHPAEGSASEVLTLVESNKGESKSATKEAEELLYEILRNGEVESKAVKRLLAEDGYSDKAIRRARENLHINVTRRGSGAAMKSYWALDFDSCPSKSFMPHQHTRASIATEGTNGKCISSNTEDKEEFEI